LKFNCVVDCDCDCVLLVNVLVLVLVLEDVDALLFEFVLGFVPVVVVVVVLLPVRPLDEEAAEDDVVGLAEEEELKLADNDCCLALEV